MFNVNITEINTPLLAKEENNFFFIASFRDISFDLQNNTRVHKSRCHDFYFTKVKTISKNE